MRTVFFDVDTQIDFMFPSGALYVPGAEQIVRVGRRNTERPKGEQAYRLFLQEVPTPARMRS